jgi:DNA-binding transcriptional LysR family regulator
LRKGAAGLQQRLARFDWIDLKFFLAVTSKGSTPSAALLSGVNRPTVQRRLADLETQSGQRLVKRLAIG